MDKIKPNAVKERLILKEIRHVTDEMELNAVKGKRL